VKDYPLSSSLSAEKSPFGSRAVQVLTVFSNIGLGNIAASIVFLVLLKAFEGSIANDLSHLEWVWRLLLGIGIIPALFTLYARLTISETVPYKQCERAGNILDFYILT
jgi:PHS family inorganic phosphate transporter-like MFS transporter